MQLTKVNQKTFKSEILIPLGQPVAIYGSLHTGIELHVFSARYKYQYRVMLSPYEAAQLRRILGTAE